MKRASEIVWEFHTGGTLFVDSSSGQFVPVPLAHLAGAAVGLLVAAFRAGLSCFPTSKA